MCLHVHARLWANHANVAVSQDFLRSFDVFANMPPCPLARPAPQPGLQMHLRHMVGGPALQNGSVVQDERIFKVGSLFALNCILGV